MPNHITNILTSPNLDGLKAIILKNDKVDFNSVVPQPAGIEDIVEGSILMTFKALFGHKSPYSSLTLEQELAAFQTFTPEDLEMCAKALRLFRETGFWSWYDWNVENWGTKWNAYETEVSDFDINFLTAWAPPEAFFQKLFDLSGIPFTVDWADEGGPSDVLVYGDPK